MYELMVDAWPTMEANPSATPAMLEFARIWKDKPKIVFSGTLERVDWNSRLVRITRPRRSPDDRMDEQGGGTPFFAALEDRIGLSLLETRTFGSGLVYLRYVAGRAQAPRRAGEDRGS
jgi:hypothetical protein